MNSYSLTFRLSWLIRDCKKLFFLAFWGFFLLIVGSPCVDWRQDTRGLCVSSIIIIITVSSLSLSPWCSECPHAKNWGWRGARPWETTWQERATRAKGWKESPPRRPQKENVSMHRVRSHRWVGWEIPRPRPWIWPNWLCCKRWSWPPEPLQPLHFRIPEERGSGVEVRGNAWNGCWRWLRWVWALRTKWSLMGWRGRCVCQPPNHWCLSGLRDQREWPRGGGVPQDLRSLVTCSGMHCFWIPPSACNVKCIHGE